MDSIPQTIEAFEASVALKFKLFIEAVDSDCTTDAQAKYYARELERYVQTVYRTRPHYFRGTTPEKFIRNLCSKVQ